MAKAFIALLAFVLLGVALIVFVNVWYGAAVLVVTALVAGYVFQDDLIAKAYEQTGVRRGR
jgi:hypothetical protein